MDIRRKAYQELLAWKKSSNVSKAIMIKGARRVGKSYLAERFAKGEYRSHILVDFSSVSREVIRIFEQYGNRDRLNEFFNQLSVYYGVALYEHESLLIFDEVQKYPPARELIKHLVADNRYDYIETGSLISIRKNVKDIVIPSEEDELLLFPLDFEEFLRALSDETTFFCIKNAYEQEKPLGNMLKPIMDRFRMYMIVGGMPQVVSEYVQSANIDRVERIKRDILKLYREDIAKYAENYVAQATAIFNAIPAQLSHHDKKIKYSALPGGRGGRFSSYADAVYWISDSMVGNFCIGTDKPEVFDGFVLQENKLKCYMGDTGLLLSLAGGENYLNSTLYKSFMLGKLSVDKGMMTENIVSQMLTANHHPLRFYETIVNRDGNGPVKYEVDFLIHEDNKVTPIEVKSGNVAEHKSMDFYRRKFGRMTNKGIILTKGDLRITEDYRYLPLPMVCFL